MYFDNIEYARRRLDHTIVNTKDKTPIFIHEVLLNMDDMYVYGMTLKNRVSTHISLKNIDIKPVQLGYLNYSNSSVYLTRKPTRASKQGLHTTHLAFFGGESFHTIPFEQLNSTIIGDYPFLENVKKLSKDHGFCLAWDRNWALCRDHLHYRGRKVGDKDLNLFDNFSYLKEELHEAFGRDMTKVEK